MEFSYPTERSSYLEVSMTSALLAYTASFLSITIAISTSRRFSICAATSARVRL